MKSHPRMLHQETLDASHGPVDVRESRCNQLRTKEKVVRPEGLEPPAYWFEARNRRTFMSLALGTMVVQHCALLRVIKDFRPSSVATLVKLRTASMHRVGTKMGTVDWIAPT